MRLARQCEPCQDDDQNDAEGESFVRHDAGRRGPTIRPVVMADRAIVVGSRRVGHVLNLRAGESAGELPLGVVEVRRVDDRGADR